MPFNTTKEVKKAFNEVRNIFIIDTIIVHFNPDKKTVVKINTSDYISEKILSQYNDKEILRKVACFFTKHILT